MSALLTKEQIEEAFEEEWVIKYPLMMIFAGAFAFPNDTMSLLKKTCKNWFLAGVMLEENKGLLNRP